MITQEDVPQLANLLSPSLETTHVSNTAKSIGIFLDALVSLLQQESTSVVPHLRRISLDSADDLTGFEEQLPYLQELGEGAKVENQSLFAKFRWRDGRS